MGPIVGYLIFEQFQENQAVIELILEIRPITSLIIHLTVMLAAYGCSILKKIKECLNIDALTSLT